MANPLNLTTTPDTIAPPSETPQESQRVTARTAAAAAFLALSLGTGGQEAQSAPATPLTADSNTIVLAQATTQETDGKIYTAEVIQVDGSKKVVKYRRDTEGVIIPPAVENGKLVDGSDAPADPLRAKIAQKKILVKYDKGAQLMLASVSKDDIIRNADKDIKEIIKLTEEGTIISKSQLSNGFYSAYIVDIVIGKGKTKKTISGLETIAKIKMHMQDQEILQMKQEAESRAIQIWKSVTGALAVS